MQHNCSRVIYISRVLGTRERVFVLIHLRDSTPAIVFPPTHIVVAADVTMFAFAIRPRGVVVMPPPSPLPPPPATIAAMVVPSVSVPSSPPSTAPSRAIVHSMMMRSAAAAAVTAAEVVALAAIGPAAWGSCSMRWGMNGGVS